MPAGLPERLSYLIILGSIIFIKLPSFDGIVPDFHLLSPSKKNRNYFNIDFLNSAILKN